MKLAFCGIQGCGKGTQARILEEKFDYKILEMGGEFRKVVNSGSELGEEIKRIMNSGAQVNGDIGRKVMETAIETNPEEKIIYDGFIRNDWNVEVFDTLVPDYKIIFFELSVEKARERLLGRMYDKETGETFPSGTVKNPKNGNTLIKRDDDKDEAAILKRISEYEEKTLPILQERMKKGEVIVVDANQSIEEVSKDLIEKLKLK